VEFSKKQTKSETLSETRDADFVWSGRVRSGRARLMEFGHYFSGCTCRESMLS